MATARALRRNLDAGVDSFPQDVVELIGYFAPPSENAARARRARRRPGREVWILGSSTYGAQLAAHARPALRLRLAFRAGRAGARARHLPLALPAVAVSRQALCHARHQRLRRAEPTRRRGCCSARCSRPSSICAPAGRDNCRRRSQDYEETLDPVARSMLAQALSTAVVGSPETVKQGIDAFIRRTGADELMVTAQIFDHAGARALVRDSGRRASGAVEGGVDALLLVDKVLRPIRLRPSPDGERAKPATG